MCWTGQQSQQSSASPTIDIGDMTDKYNTPLTSVEEAAYRKWAKDIGHENDTRDYDLRGAFKAGAGQSDNGHFTDQFKKPNHPTFSKESQYNGVDGYVGGSWGDGEAFTPGPANLKFHSAKELQDYFKKVEPNGSVILPAATANDLTIPYRAR